MFWSMCDNTVHLQLYLCTTFVDTPRLCISWLTWKICLSGLNRTSRINFGLEQSSGSGRAQASKWGRFTTLCRYVCRGQKGEIESIHPPPTNSKFRSKSFCEVGYANFRPSVFAPGKRISMEILVGVRLHARCPVARKSFVTFSKNGNVQEKYLSSL